MVADEQVSPGPSPIVLFGATGHTGRLLAARLAAAGARPLLVGRDPARTAELAGALGGLEHATADARRPGTVAAVVPPGGILISTVGPFTRWGNAALSAAIARGAAYLDSTGEPAFIASVFARDADARRTGARLLPAMGYDYVPGALAGALALRDGGRAATHVEIGYFAPGRSADAGLSRGTRMSAAMAACGPSYAYRDGRLRRARLGDRARRLRVDGRSTPALSVGGAEHFGLPPAYPGLRRVDVYAGWFGAATPLVRIAAAGLAGLQRLPPLRGPVAALARRVADAPTDAVSEGAGESLATATARDDAGRPLARVVLRGPEPYAFTARFMAWAGLRVAEAGVSATGALGPVAAFGLDVLREGCAQAGLRVEVEHSW